MPSNLHPLVRRIGQVDDHETTTIGLAAVLAAVPDLDMVAASDTVAGLLSRTTELDLVVLDLRLQDGSSARTNVEQLRQVGIEALVYTGGDDPYLMRAAAHAGVLGIVPKATPIAETIEAIRRAANGEHVVTLDWAAAIDGDPALPDVGLSPRQLEVLALYASGEKSGTVARRTGLSEQTVHDYLGRIRRKYAEVGRPAPTKTDLYKRAIEDGLLPRPQVNQR